MKRVKSSLLPFGTETRTLLAVAGLMPCLFLRGSPAQWFNNKWYKTQAITCLTTQKWAIIKVLVTQDSPRGRVTWVQSINCITQLLLGLGLDLVLLAEC